LLVSKQDHEMLGATEFEIRDRVHQLGAHAIETALNERKKGVVGVRTQDVLREPCPRLSSQLPSRWRGYAYSDRAGRSDGAEFALSAGNCSFSLARTGPARRRWSSFPGRVRLDLDLTSQWREGNRP
jgi:hypothetical protein